MGTSRKKKASRRTRGDEKRRTQELERKLAQVEAGALRRGFASSRDAMAAMIVVKAIDRAQDLSSAEGRPSPALRRALAQARRALGGYIASQVRRPRPAGKKRGKVAGGEQARRVRRKA